MTQNLTVYNAILLDASGSMESIKSSIISSFGELLQTMAHVQELYPEQKQMVSFYSFNDQALTPLMELVPVAEVTPISAQNYLPSGGTPLYDAMAFVFGRMQAMSSLDLNHKVIVTILTDGEENASKKSTRYQIAQQVKMLEEKGWVISFIGTEFDVHQRANELQISNRMSFDKSAEGLADIMSSERTARMDMAEKLRENKFDNKSYYITPSEK